MCVYVTNPSTCLYSLTVVFLVSQVSSVEVVQAYIDRIQEVNPLLNAVIKDRQERPSSSDTFTFIFLFLLCSGAATIKQELAQNVRNLCHA